MTTAANSVMRSPPFSRPPVVSTSTTTYDNSASLSFEPAAGTAGPCTARVSFVPPALPYAPGDKGRSASVHEPTAPDETRHHLPSLSRENSSHGDSSATAM